MSENILEYKLVVTPASRRAWLGTWDSDDRGPQIRRASFFPADLNTREEGNVAILHAVKNSEGLLAKEFVILSQNIHKQTGQPSATQNLTRQTGISISRPRRAESFNKHISSTNEQRAAACHSISGSIRSDGIPRTKSDCHGVFTEDPQVAAILRASNSGSHYLLASCTRKEKPMLPLPLLEGSTTQSDQPIILKPSSEPEPPHSATISWRRRVFAPATGAVNSNNSVSAHTRAAGEKRKKQEAGNTEARSPPPSEAGPPPEAMRCPGSVNSFRRRRPGLTLQPESWRGTSSYQVLPVPGAEDIPIPALTRVYSPSFWLAGRRNPYMVPSCWTGSANDLASELESPGEAVIVEKPSGCELALDLGSKQVPPLDLLSGEESGKDTALPNADEIEAEVDWQPSCFSFSVSHSRENSPPHSRPRRTHHSLSWSQEIPREGSFEAGTPSNHSVAAPFRARRGVSFHKPSPPKEKPSNTFVGMPELAIRFYRPGLSGKSFMPPNLRAMGPGEGFVRSERRTDWVMEGIPAGAFNQLGSFTGLGGEQVADGGILTHVREESSPLIDLSDPVSTFMGQAGTSGSGCVISIHGSKPSLPALEMFGDELPGGRCMAFAVKVDGTQLTALQAFAYCLARADSFIAGGLRTEEA